MRDVDALLGAWAEAIARGDVPRIAELVTDDAEFWSQGAPAVQGRAAVEALFTGFFAKYAMVQEITEVERIVAGDVAIIRALERNVLTPKPGGDAIEVRQRAFTILRREAGEWRFARGMNNGQV